MQVNSIMSRSVATVQPDATAREVARLFLEEGIGSAVVEADTPTGIVTEHDLTSLVAEGGNPDSTTASAFMSEGLTTIDGSATVEEAARIMKEKGVKKLPVTYGGALVGIVTTTDISYVVPDIAGDSEGEKKLAEKKD